jgi:hypothetical protein
MAIGDAVAIFIGTAVSNYQPSSGVEVQLSSTIKSGTSDPLLIYDGTNTNTILDDDVVTAEAFDNANTTRRGAFNMSILLTNTMYIRKTGTSDRIYLGGVQTNA